MLNKIEMVKNAKLGTFITTDITRISQDDSNARKEYVLKCIGDGIGRIVSVENTKTKKKMQGVIEDIDFETSNEKRYIVFTENGECIDTLHDVDFKITI